MTDDLDVDWVPDKGGEATPATAFVVIRTQD
jgi:hypothetical protein